MDQDQGIIVVGAGGHGQVVADVIMEMNIFGRGLIAIGFVDDDPSFERRMINNLLVFGNVRSLRQIKHDAVIIAVGDNLRRKQLYEELLLKGESLAVICHPRAIISQNVEVGAGCQIIAGVVINTGTRIGRNTIINTGCTIDHHNSIGDHVHIAPGVHLGGEVIIEDGAFIGIGSTILPRCRIGKGCTIGAGSVVLNNIADGEFVYGSPARPRKPSPFKYNP